MTDNEKGLYADIPASLHDTASSAELPIKEQVARGLRLYHSDHRERDAEARAGALEARAEVLRDQATTLRSLADDLADRADDAEDDAEALRADARDAAESTGSGNGVAEAVDVVEEWLVNNSGTVVFPAHGVVQDAASSAGVGAEQVLDSLDARSNVDPDRVLDEAPEVTE